MMKISFDYDDVLSENKMVNLAKLFIANNHEVWITTGRVKHKKWNNDIYKLAKELNIPENRIQITDGIDKWRYLKGFDIHFDDSNLEIELIDKNMPSCIGVCVYN